MAYQMQDLIKILKRTDGRCHLCREELHINDYGRQDLDMGWEVDHSRPQSKGGTDHLNNLFPACISCNRSKGNASNRREREKHGYRNPPYSSKQKTRNALTGGTVGALATFLVPPQFRLLAFIASSAAGALIGYLNEPE